MAQDKPRLDLLQGTLDLLILRALRTGAMHGWAVSERIQQISQDVLQVNDAAYGLLLAVGAIGSIGGGLLASRVIRKLGDLLALQAAMVHTSNPNSAICAIQVLFIVFNSALVVPQGGIR